MWWCPTCKTLRPDSERACLNDGTLRRSAQPPHRAWFVEPRNPEMTVTLTGFIQAERDPVRRRTVYLWPFWMPMALLIGAALERLIPAVVAQPRLLIPVGGGLLCFLLLLGVIRRFNRNMARNLVRGVARPILRFFSPLQPEVHVRRRLIVQLQAPPGGRQNLARPVGVEIDHSGPWVFRAGPGLFRFTGKWIHRGELFRASAIEPANDQTWPAAVAAVGPETLLGPALAVAACYLMVAATLGR